MKKELALLLVGLTAVAIPAEQLKLEGDAFEDAFDEETFADAIIAKGTELNGLTALPAKVIELEATIQTLTTEKTELAKFKTDNEPKLAQLTVVESYKATLLADVLKASDLIAGKATEASLRATFEAADVKTLEAFKQTYESQLEAKFPMECQSCGGHEVARATVEVETDDNPTPKAGNTKLKPKSFEEIRKSRRDTPSAGGVDWLS